MSRKKKIEGIRIAFNGATCFMAIGLFVTDESWIIKIVSIIVAIVSIYDATSSINKGRKK